MRVADGRMLEVSERSEPELFRATLGGMGLTGHILEVELRSCERDPDRRGSSRRARRVDDLDDAASRRLLEASRRLAATPSAGSTAPSAGRRWAAASLLMGRWAEPGEAPAQPPRCASALSVPFDLPARRW